jgi:hypothetical protein
LLLLLVDRQRIVSLSQFATNPARIGNSTA